MPRLLNTLFLGSVSYLKKKGNNTKPAPKVCFADPVLIVTHLMHCNHSFLWMQETLTNMHRQCPWIIRDNQFYTDQLLTSVCTETSTHSMQADQFYVVWGAGLWTETRVKVCSRSLSCFHFHSFDEKKMIKTDPEMKDSAGTAALDISHGHSFISTVTFYKVTGRKLSTGYAEAPEIKVICRKSKMLRRLTHTRSNFANLPGVVRCTECLLLLL